MFLINEVTPVELAEYYYEEYHKLGDAKLIPPTFDELLPSERDRMVEAMHETMKRISPFLKYGLPS
jgi:hypothetical protein